MSNEKITKVKKINGLRKFSAIFGNRIQSMLKLYCAVLEHDIKINRQRVLVRKDFEFTLKNLE